MFGWEAACRDVGMRRVGVRELGVLQKAEGLCSACRLHKSCCCGQMGPGTKGFCALLRGCDMFIAIGASHGALASIVGGNIRAPVDQLFACQQWSQSAFCMR